MVTNLSGGHKLEVLGRQLRVEEGARGGVEVEDDAQEHHMDDVSADADARQTPVKLRYRLILNIASCLFPFQVIISS